jgi:DNA-directed RNA polymerase subunit beta
VTTQIEYLTADREESYIIAQANSAVDDKGRYVNEKVTCRWKGEFLDVEPARVDYMDVSPKQLVSVAAGLIPFLEHDDANRALMGSNMQRQAVPLLISEAPLVATGLEERVARDSRAVIVAEEAGKVASVTGHQIIITRDGKLPEGKKKIKHDPANGVHLTSCGSSCARTRRPASTRKSWWQGRHGEEGADHRRRSLHERWRAGAGPERPLRVHAVGRV